MTEHVFEGPPGTVYPDARDARGQPVGTVEPGEIRRFPAALDHWWRETAREDRAAQAAGTGHPADGTWSPPVSSEPPPAAAAPPVPAGQPAPPAVLPQPSVPSASTEQQEG